MSVKPRGHVVTSAIVRYYKVVSIPDERRHKSYTTLLGYSAKKRQPVSTSLALADNEATEVWYGTTEGVVGTVDLQQSNTSSQVISYDITMC